MSDNSHIAPDPTGEQKFIVTEDGKLEQREESNAEFEEDLTFNE